MTVSIINSLGYEFPIQGTGGAEAPRLSPYAIRSFDPPSWAGEMPGLRGPRVFDLFDSLYQGLFTFLRVPSSVAQATEPGDACAGNPSISYPTVADELLPLPCPQIH